MTNVHIPLSMKTGPGKSNVSLNYGAGKNVFLRLAQYRLYEGEEKGSGTYTMGNLPFWTSFSFTKPRSCAIIEAEMLFDMAGLEISKERLAIFISRYNVRNYG